MRRSFLLVCVAARLFLPAPVDAQELSPLAGVWTLNRSQSEMPREIGFNINCPSSPGGAGQAAGSSGGGGRGRRGSGGGRANAGPSAFSASRESYDDARRLSLLTAEARNPPARLMIVDTPALVTITNELGQSRALHPHGKEESIKLEDVPVLVTTKREGDRLVVDYAVEQGRDVRYTFSHSTSPSQLIVEVQFLERGGGDKAKRVYEPGVATRTVASAGGATPPPPVEKQPGETFDGRPGAELRGLQSLGILVEDFGTQVAACGLNHDLIEAVLSKRLTDGGFTVRRNSDEDTYLYVNVMTTTLSTGTCVSRYDVFLYTHATAKLSYHDQPVLVQVSLMHRGGIGSSAPAAHASAVARGLENYVDLVVQQIRDANK